MGSRRGRAETYTGAQKACHWGIALFCAAEFPTAAGIQKIHIGHVFGIRPSTNEVLFATAHEWFGWTILILTSILIASRLIRGAPSMPFGMAWWQRSLAHAAHIAIYLGVIALVASGLATAYFDGRLGFFHVLLTRIGIGLIAFHVSAVIWHQLIRRDGLLGRMFPDRQQ